MPKFVCAKCFAYFGVKTTLLYIKNGLIFVGDLDRM